MDLTEFDTLVTSHDGVRRQNHHGSARWKVDGRMVAREVDATHVAIRVPFDVRDALVRQHPDVFTVPSRLAKHMTVVADLAAGDDDAVEDAVRSGWRLQTGA